MSDLASFERAPKSEPQEVTILRDGEPDLVIARARLLLTAQTRPFGLGEHATKRWKVFRLYRAEPSGTLVVAEEGHSSREHERILRKGHVCQDAVAAWKVMGKLDDLKKPFAELGLPVVERL